MPHADLTSFKRFLSGRGRMVRASLIAAISVGIGLSSLAAGENDNGEPDFLSNVRQLTFEGKRAGEGYFSRDGRYLVFQSEREPDNPFFQIYLMDLETGDTIRISPGQGKTTCSWVHPDGSKVLYASTQDDPKALAKQREEFELRASGRQRRYSWDYDENFELYVADTQGHPLQRLTHARGYDAEGDYSPDGRGIVFASNRAAYEKPLSGREKELFETDKSYFMDLYTMDADGSNLRRLTDVPGYDGGPFFSWDGSRICWRRFSEDGARAEIYLMNADGTDQHAITKMGALSWAPFFYPTDDYLVFATNKHGFANFEIYMVDAEGRSEPIRVTYTDGFDGLPVFSPDGRRMAWTSNRTSDGTSQIFIADWNDAAARQALGIGAGAKNEDGPFVADVDLSQLSAEIRPEDLSVYVHRLASDEMEGRLTGSPGERSAGGYIAGIFRELGLRPAGDDGTYFQAFEFTAGVSLGRDNQLRVSVGGREKEFRAGEQWRPLAISDNGAFDAAPVVFAGYGIVAPEKDGLEEYDSYVHLDVADKWVLALRDYPEDVTDERRQHLSHFSSNRYKAMVARDRGAKGLLVFNGPNSKKKNQLVELGFDAALQGTSIAAISVSNEVGEMLLRGAGRDAKELQATLDAGEPMMGIPLEGVTLSAHVDLIQEKETGRNVLARLPCAGCSPDSPALVIGAHYDHLGRGESGSSLAHDDEKGMIHHGADDNGSGTASLLEIAHYLTAQTRSGRLRPTRDLLFTAWSGEELGLLGSNHFVNSYNGQDRPDLSSDFEAYLNMDMVGRMKDKVVMQGVGSSTDWPSIIEKRNAPVGLSIVTQNESYLPTDATSFYLKRVPILSAFTGSHEDYHSPRDTADKINYEGVADISRFMALVARDLALRTDRLEYVEMERPKSPANRGGLRATLGTVPDYVPAAVPGLKISGVSKGGPADQAGLKGGDVIVELAGHKIENIYDYTFAIEALKIGEPVSLTYLRDGRRVEVKITPVSRD